MPVNRRDFLVLSTAFAAGCATNPDGLNRSPEAGKRLVNAGPASQYLTDGVYPRYRDLGFFIVRHGAALFAISSVCTHRKCKLDAQPDQTFHCPCHGSTFDGDGHVMQGPARRGLPRFQIITSEKGDLLVRTSSA